MDLPLHSGLGVPHRLCPVTTGDDTCLKIRLLDGVGGGGVFVLSLSPVQSETSDDVVVSTYRSRFRGFAALICFLNEPDVVVCIISSCR